MKRKLWLSVFFIAITFCLVIIGVSLVDASTCKVGTSVCTGECCKIVGNTCIAGPCGEVLK